MSGDGDSETIRNKLLLTLRGNKAFLDRSTFTWSESSTDQLQSLGTAKAETINITPVDTDELGALINTITRYDILVDGGTFLGLVCKPKKFYVREGYDELYDCMCEYWKSDYYRVVLLGNSGTGKSWFQVYVLKRLLSCGKDNREFDFVIRQVASSFYLIDLDEAKVYLWEIAPQRLISLSEKMDRTLYFFEPGKVDANAPPLDVVLPSLATLSLCSRIKEYRKDRCRIVYFWPWSSGELRAVLQDSVPPISDADFSVRYHKFGGIVRHILTEDLNVEILLEQRLAEIDVKPLTAQFLNIDRDATRGNVSGFLICYDNRSIKGNGNDRFGTINLDFTSSLVVEEVQVRIQRIPVQESMKIVLKRLDREKASDVSAKHLARVAMELLSQGRDFRWERKDIGSDEAGWEDFAVSKRTVVREFCLTDQFCHPGFLLAPTKLNFPVIDFVLSVAYKGESPVVAFQCTWAKTHDVKVKALCTLRKKIMDISDNQILEIYMVCPDLEDAYASRDKAEFLVGRPKENFTLDGKLVRLAELETILVNTKLFVIRPKEVSWEEQICTYLSNRPYQSCHG